MAYVDGVLSMDAKQHSTCANEHNKLKVISFIHEYICTVPANSNRYQVASFLFLFIVSIEILAVA